MKRAANSWNGYRVGMSTDPQTPYPAPGTPTDDDTEESPDATDEDGDEDENP